jgi:autotransporter translocation and assembly factor TamB
MFQSGTMRVCISQSGMNAHIKSDYMIKSSYGTESSNGTLMIRKIKGAKCKLNIPLYNYEVTIHTQKFIKYNNVTCYVDSI